MTTTTNPSMTFQEICDDLPVRQLENSVKRPFWYSDAQLEKRFAHEKAERGDIFFDGNNGDTWKVLATCKQWGRMVVENLTQGGIQLVWWK